MSDPRLTGTKHCKKCDRELPVICFSVCRGHSDGLSACCRDCEKEGNKSRGAKKRKKHNSFYISNEIGDF